MCQEIDLACCDNVKHAGTYIIIFWSKERRKERKEEILTVFRLSISVASNYQPDERMGVIFVPNESFLFFVFVPFKSV